ncbi:ImmA/IrrE family metallo-endopeptidase [Bathymodiolus septemdierum thioautotrophic gill symbiont]|uniref:HTH cro/C1-type domain-containing protein n=1 Tax=endosymbiont of Bathymodiolus septemdierum str. Myojin knoll TaxID=1303921 RepID=A0A0P0US02_9GAMM|nr:ImmA/IrrE family metallo-endopeptidase [Bathymodiolus septemdierum thioautotrophic gill symbiont]BAS67849.1 conserved hypothetical protein [endosymbiont of Bathymodiolus septemdierum str. Myojin knoll]
MIKLDLIEFADYIRPKEIVDEILKQNPNIKIPIPLSEIAKNIGIVDIDYRPLGNLEGALVANEYKTEGVILINNSKEAGTKERQRFTLGHEIGHFMIPRHGHKMSCSISDMSTTNKDEKIEIEANDFASKILMPDQLFCKGSLFDNPSIENIKKLAVIYGVSFAACSNKYITNHHEPLAMVFYKNKKFRYFKKSKDFPFYFSFECKKGTQLPLDSLANNLNDFSDENISLDYTDASVWISKTNGFLLPDEIIEEVYIQKNGYSVVLLKFEEEIEEIENY